MSLNTINDDDESVNFSGAWSKASQSGAYWDGVSSTDQNGAAMMFSFGRGSVAVYVTVSPCPNERAQIAAHGSVNGGPSDPSAITCNLATRYGVQLYKAGPFTSVSNVLTLTNTGMAPLQVDRIEYAEMDGNGATPPLSPGNPIPPPAAAPGNGGTGTFAARPLVAPVITSSPPRATSTPTPAISSLSPSTSASKSSSNNVPSSTLSTTSTIQESAVTSSLISTTVSVIPGTVVLTTINGVPTSVSRPPTLTTIDIYGNGPAGPTIVGTASGKSSRSMIPIIAGIIGGCVALLLLLGVFLVRHRQISRRRGVNDEGQSAHPFDSEAPGRRLIIDKKSAPATLSDDTHIVSSSFAAALQLKASLFPAEKLQNVPAIRPLTNGVGEPGTRNTPLQESAPDSHISLPEYRWSRIGRWSHNDTARSSSLLRTSQIMDRPPIYTQ